MKIAYVLLSLLFSSFSLLAQTLQDDFTDGDFSNNPTWVGNATEFTVTAGELQTNNLGNGATSYLSTAAAIQDSTTWEFYFRLDFNPSTSNQMRVYLQSDAADLTAAQNGYYLQVGASGSTDAIEVYRLDAGVSTLLFSGTSGAVATAPAASIRKVRDAIGNWSVFADYAGGTTYALEGTFADATHATGSHFGVSAEYTTTRGDKFFFDNILVSPLFVDVTPPSITSLTAVSGTELEVRFDELVALPSANVAANYALNGGANVIAANRDAIDLDLVYLTTSALTSGQNYTLTVNGVEDANGNATAGASANVTYINAQPAAFQDVIINEIFADPNPQQGLPAEEYLELYNRSNKIIDLATLVINDGSDKALPSQLLYPDSVVVLASSANVALFAPFGTTVGIASLTLTNGGELITLKNTAGTTIDSVDYQLSWYQDNIKDDGGWSLELINPTLLCEGSNNWIASIDNLGGTPGQPNSVFDNTPDTQAPSLDDATFDGATNIVLAFDQGLTAVSATNTSFYAVTNNTVTSANLVQTNQVRLTLGSPMVDGTRYFVTVNGPADCSGNAATNEMDSFDYINVQPAGFHDLLITEIFADPTPQVGLPEAEFIELYNASNKTIDLANYELFESTTRTLPRQLMSPGDYVIVCGAADQALFASYGTVVPVSNLSLTNSGELLILYNANGATVDSVEYSASWYADNNKDDGGYTLSLVNPNLLCKGGENWRASVAAAGGTPGIENLLWETTTDNTPPAIEDIRQFGPNQVLLEFDDVLNPTQASTTSTYGINNGASIITVVVLSPREVLLTLSSNMVDQTTYTVTLTALEDCVGNTASNLSGSFTYFESGAAEHYDIILNEIMADPNPPVGLPEVEYVELYNRSNKTFNLQDFTLQDGSSVISTLPFYILRPGEYVTIQSSSDSSLAFFGPVLRVTPFPDLNTSDEIILRDPTSEVIDAVAYELFWYQNADKDNGGWSLERINPDRPCEAADNWAASQALAGGTPSQVNSLLSINPDRQALDLLRAFPENATTLRLFFSEAVDDVLGADAANYELEDANGQDLSNTITNAFLEPPFYNTVMLTLSQPLVLGTVYTLTVKSNVPDCVGNPVGLLNSAKIALPQDIQPGDLILNEILFDPVTRGKDFVELYNTSDKYLNANDLVFSNAIVVDGNLANTTTLQTRPVEADLLIAPKSYIVFTEGPEQVMEQYQVTNGENFLQSNLPTYDDREGSVFLYAAYDSSYLDQFGNPQTAYLVKTLDLFDYTNDMHSPLIDNLKGVSLERIDFDAPTNDGNNWFSAATEVGYATPGRQNSVQVTNTIDGVDLIELPTETVSPDGDGYEDVLLINYTTGELGFVANIDIYDAHGVLVRTLVNGELLLREGTLRWDGTDNLGKKARIGIHLIAVEIFQPDGTVRRFKKTCVVAGRMN